MTRSSFPLYVGAFLGPFGGGVVAVLIPQLRDAFDASTAQVALSVPAYLVPFAALQLVSGTIGERYGRRRVVRAAYLVYALVSAAAALAPDIGTFLAVRALAGAANAFVTPLLLAGLADVAAGSLGRAAGTFAAVQTAAVAMAPLCGGLLGELTWRLAFLAPAALALALASVPPADAVAAEPGAAPVRLRSVVTSRVGLLSAAAFAGYAGGAGTGFLVALLVADEFGVGSVGRGLVLCGFGVAGVLLGRAAGGAADRVGRVPVVAAGSVACGVLVAAVGVAPDTVAVAALWTLAGVGSAFVWAGLNTLTVEAVPSNRAGGTSVIGAFKFAGNAAAPLMWLPLFHADVRLGFLAAGVMTALSAVFVLPLRRTGRQR